MAGGSGNYSTLGYAPGPQHDLQVQNPPIKQASRPLDYIIKLTVDPMAKVEWPVVVQG